MRSAASYTAMVHVAWQPLPPAHLQNGCQIKHLFTARVAGTRECRQSPLAHLWRTFCILESHTAEPGVQYDCSLSREASVVVVYVSCLIVVIVFYFYYKTESADFPRSRAASIAASTN